MALLPLGNKGPRKPLYVTRYHIQVIMQELLLVFLKQQESQTRAATPSFILCKYVSPQVAHMTNYHQFNSFPGKISSIHNGATSIREDIWASIFHFWIFFHQQNSSLQFNKPR
ncbi:hypothetical protein YC2023_014200 [Brassica napus]